LKKIDRTSKLTLWTSIGFYLLSLFFTGFSYGYDNNDAGFVIVLFGWYDIFGSLAGFTWLANPLIWLGWISVRYAKKSLMYGLTAFLLMAIFAFTKSITNPGPCGSWLEPSYCPQLKIEKLNLGYYLWIASAISLVIFNIYSLNRSNSTNKITPPS
jgi:hypothetical protein